jgi:hypothetical protein
VSGLSKRSPSLRPLQEATFDFEVFYRRRHRLESLSFYLSANQCSRANEATAAVEQHRFETNGMTVTNKTFSPHDDMNETYFL